MKIAINALQYKHNSSGIGVMIRDLFGAYCRGTQRRCQVVMPNNAPEFPGGAATEMLRIKACYEQGFKRMWFQSFRLGKHCENAVLLTTDSKIPFILPKSCLVMPLITDLAVYRLKETYKLSRVLWWRLQYWYLRRRADRFLAVSEFTKRDIIELLQVPADKIDVVHCACGEYFKPVQNEETLMAVRKKYNLPERLVLFVGNFNPRKNLERLMQAFDLLKEKADLPQHLVIAGEQGWKFDKKQALSGIKHSSEIHFCGFVADADMPALYAAADLFVFPTLYEGFGIPVLEAQSCGAPVLTSNVSSLPEVAGTGAVYVDPYSVESIAAGMQRVLTDKELATQLREAGLKNGKRFSWQQSAERLNEIIEREIAKRETVR